MRPPACTAVECLFPHHHHGAVTCRYISKRARIKGLITAAHRELLKLILLGVVEAGAV